MTLIKKMLAGAAVAATLATSAQAVTVQGISWDAGPVLGQFNFRQELTGGELKGMGEFYYFGKTDMSSLGVTAASPTGGAAGSFAPGRELTFTFGGFIANNATGQFTGGTLNMYSDNANNFTSGGVTTDYSKASDSDFGTPFLQLMAVSSTFVADPGTLGFQSGALSVVWEVTGGAAMSFFDTDSFPFGGGLVDVTSRASTTFAGVGFSQTGANGQINTYSVPEPESLALVGLGLLGIVGLRRRKSA